MCRAFYFFYLPLRSHRSRHVYCTNTYNLSLSLSIASLHYSYTILVIHSEATAQMFYTLQIRLLIRRKGKLLSSLAAQHNHLG